MTSATTGPSRDAEARLATLRSSYGMAARLIADAVWEDARRQLAGMLTALAELRTNLPALDEPAWGYPQAGTPGQGSRPRGRRPGGRGEASGLAPGLPATPTPSTMERGTTGRRNSATTDRSLWALDLTRLAELLHKRQVSPVEVTRAVLDRIAAYDAQLCTFITVTAEKALAAAREAERQIGAGRYLGPLHGVPVAAKDLFATAGVRTTCGATILRDWVPDEDAVAVAAWRAAGALLVGKNTLHEFAFGGTSVNEHTGTPRNPWRPEHICGGSSGGSAAAVAAGFAFGALGSETGNSVRRPASFCGVVGLKPTFGRVSRRGVLPLAWTLDHVGVFARTAADVALLLAPLCGIDASDPGSRRPLADGSVTLEPAADLRGRRAGVPRALLSGHDPDVEQAFERALAALRARGVEVREVKLPLAGQWTAMASSVTMHAEAAAVHARWLHERPQDYGHDVLARLLAGQALTAADYARAQAIRDAVTAELLDALSAVDVVIAPATPAPAPLRQSGAYVPGDAPWSTEPHPFHLQRLFSLAGVPAASAPCGLHPSGLPMGIQIGGRPWEEGLVLGLAAAVMESVPDQLRLSPIAPLTA